MLEVQSNIVTINKSAKELSTYVSDLRNHKDLISPEVQDYTATENTCSFNLRGLIKMTLIIDHQSYTELKLVPKPESNTMFNVSLIWTFTEKGNVTQVGYKIKADVNTFLAMTFKKTLKDLVNYEVQKLAEILNQ